MRLRLLFPLLYGVSVAVAAPVNPPQSGAVVTPTKSLPVPDTTSGVVTGSSKTKVIQKPQDQQPLASDPLLEQRLFKLERILGNQVLVNMLGQIEDLQKEVMELRSFNEEQGYELQSLKKRQRDLYLDIDRRISQTERDLSSRPTKVITEQERGLTSTTTDIVVQADPSQDGAATSDLSPQSVPGDAAASVEQSADSESVNAATSEPTSEQLVAERNAYQEAFNLLRQLKYEPATRSFRQFIKDFPQGRYAHIAQYWLAEASYARRDFKQAIIDYQRLLNDYPKSPKVAEAMLKMGYCRFELDRKDEAKTILQQLLDRFPKATESDQARNLLKQIGN